MNDPNKTANADIELPGGLGGEIYRELKSLKKINADKAPQNAFDRGLSKFLGIILISIAIAIGLFIFVLSDLPWNVNARASIVIPALLGVGFKAYNGISGEWLLAAIGAYWYGILFFIVLYILVGYLFIGAISDSLEDGELALLGAFIMWLVSITGMLYMRTSVRVIKQKSIEDRKKIRQRISLFYHQFMFLLFLAFFVGAFFMFTI